MHFCINTQLLYFPSCGNKDYFCNTQLQMYEYFQGHAYMYMYPNYM